MFGALLRHRYSFMRVQKVALHAVNDLDWIRMGESVVRPFCSVCSITLHVNCKIAVFFIS